MNLTEITTAIADGIKTSATPVQEKVVATLVGKEVDRRASAIIDGLSKLDTLRRELSKVTPDVATFNVAGEKLTEAYSDKQLKAYRDATGKVDKIQKALEKALTTNDYGDLFNLAKGGGEKKSDEPAAAA